MVIAFSILTSIERRRFRRAAGIKRERGVFGFMRRLASERLTESQAIQPLLAIAFFAMMVVAALLVF